MAKVSVIIPTHNRPEPLYKAVSSVLNQTYKDLEVIVVDGGLDRRAEEVVRDLNDPRVAYIKSDKDLNGSEARNIGIRRAGGEFIALLDDDDEWLSEKLDIQMKAFEHTPREVGFCFSAVKNVYDNKIQDTKVPSGIRDYFEVVLARLKGFLSVTLIVKKYVLEDVGYFDERLPSHQETELVLRISKKYKGLGINQPLVLVSMRKGYEKVGFDINKRIVGREIIINKYMEDYKKRPVIFAGQLFRQGLLHRSNDQMTKARDYFKKAWDTDHRPLYILHYLSLIGGGRIYRWFRK
ncbi:MAG: hypothetical protein A3B99_04325 [Candidatus Yanofskybacteria bacterium RIFCSPHIGHO2_02_FULL_44_12b]|uniref:Glycosyltransferase 2-like domain-containing protein n=2 Tax=Candidatus Yanofskyibacteriota TaxID=1752733 RepID=A0A1F8GN00_9BACT|nr:MAG: Glycosyl transferase [Candidatus Yanofskybacteria bacterium GW2011_GWA2_44_9]OGN04595.1 MAG: hypothetical protein A2659_00515 [Candidatus Yanofskybacteria bacterium RIFCSPHIGHO2_01_FULL_44_24]OGN15739.1 MAG: hypothetical protein A3B99_04325 [Candidatus Yanofskybacteria bacterium RIFCSPHIGHO2_02_FULL_44_12b]OGN26795.1 MAG: hypothetical protein A2925_04410 [Candidatus Yanofskybacteria bacterium RIFCSPLOWO2_01_FULL_44_22]